MINRMLERRQPQRSCIVCGSKRAKAELLRLALDGAGRVCLDQQQKCHGRGAYVCWQPGCLTRLNLARLQRAFRRSLSKDAWNTAQAMAQALQSSNL